MALLMIVIVTAKTETTATTPKTRAAVAMLSDVVFVLMGSIGGVVWVWVEGSDRKVGCVVSSEHWGSPKEVITTGHVSMFTRRP